MNKAESDKHFKDIAKRKLKGLLMESGIDYEVLAERINADYGHSETKNSIMLKVNRGSYPHFFYQMILTILGKDVLVIDKDHKLQDSK